MGSDVEAQLLAMMRSLMGDVNSNGAVLVELQQKLDLVLAAFPCAEKGGLLAHRMYHERKKVEEADNHQTKQDVKTKLLASALTFAFTMTAIAIWEFIKLHFRA